MLNHTFDMEALPAPFSSLCTGQCAWRLIAACADFTSHKRARSLARWGPFATAFGTVSWLSAQNSAHKVIRSHGRGVTRCTFFPRIADVMQVHATSGVHTYNLPSKLYLQHGVSVHSTDIAINCLMTWFTASAWTSSARNFWTEVSLTLSRMSEHSWSLQRSGRLAWVSSFFSA